ncbi:MAG: capsule assembly Wzi family protein [Armatimonadota bacterium]
MTLCSVRPSRLCLLITVVLVFCGITCFAQPTASTDRVPTENWTYNALMHLAAGGLIPSVPAERFMGDWLYTREEMAAFTLSAFNAANEKVTEKDRALLSRLAAEYSAEIRSIGGEEALSKLQPYAESHAFIPTGSFESRFMHSDGDDHLTGIYDGTLIATSGKYVTYVATLSDRRRKLDGDEFSDLEKLLVRGKTPNWEWEIGRDYQWWGPGYSGSMILSDNSPAFMYFLAAKDVNFGRRIGNIKITQFVAPFEDGGINFYLLGRRWEKRLSRQFHVGINETAKTSKTPNPLVLILPSLYLYQHIFVDDVDAEWNSFLSIDALYKFSPRFEGYFDFLVDDMNAPPILRNGNWHRPRKLGFFAGSYWPNLLGDGSTGLRAEYIFTDEGTYGATRPEYFEHEYTHSGLVIGHPVGRNSKALFLRLDRKLAERWTGVAEYLDRSPRDKEGVDPDNTSSLRLLLVHDLNARSSISAGYESLRLPEKESQFNLSASVAF